MKYLVFTDIHGSGMAMEEICAIYENEKCDNAICLGDLLYHGPRNALPQSYDPMKVAQMVKKTFPKMIWIQGNCDAEVDEMVTGMHFYKKKTIRAGSKNIILTHGHHLSKHEPDESLGNDDIVLYGHYHVFDITDINGTKYVSVGSPSIPKDQIRQYAIIDDKSIKIYNLYDYSILGQVKL